MALDSTQLEAFVEVSREKHFSRAAANLGLTQSALSIRIKNLEDSIGTSLFIRGRSGVRLTETAEKLLRYCRAKDSLENEFLGSLLSSRSDELSGVVRIAGYSSIARSYLLPTVAPLLRSHRQVQFLMQSREMGDLPELLKQGEVDYLITDHEIESDAIESVLLGYESNVLVSHTKLNVSEDVYLDHDERDRTTWRFFQIQNHKPKTMRRIYLDDIYGILDGVKLGLGRAVLPRHLIEGEGTLRVVEGYKILRSPVYLHYFKQPYYSRLHGELIQVLVGAAKKMFDGRKSQSVK